ncbi:MAG TPA: 1-deoxy-D-xylulose-5-phosphate reductoisomerase [Methylomirabilota bacterium]|jgi:1-deoxy-D-xylulose-5-phosphate reductoisomerase|nr:1-deoxy-D-xylulose-5-phosphate reductoisomerase [Methylomirabilota bacterium]
MKRLTVLGVTGSVGRRALELVEQFPQEFRVEGMAARGSRPELIAELCAKHRPRALAISDPAAADAVARALPRPRPEILSGAAGLVALAAEVDADIVLSAIVGGAGLLPTMAAIRTGKTVALANKETLVMAGSLMTQAAREHRVALLPVDSEHSAIFQCLQGHDRAAVHRILLTASGGPFRTLPKAELHRVTVAETLRHPTWKMGAKITVDSATLMNKGLEVIEARWLFDLAPAQVQVVVHPQSIVHSMVEYVDGSVIAQLGVADMGIPILYALTYPNRLSCDAARLDLTQVGSLTFEEADTDRFPCLALARRALTEGGCAPVILNAANEVAVAAFLGGRIRFTQIPELIDEALGRVPNRPLDAIESCVEVDARARALVGEWLPDARLAGAAAE